MAKRRRLSDPRDVGEVVADSQSPQDRRLMSFLQQVSVRTRVYAGAERFVAELHARWMRRRGGEGVTVAPFSHQLELQRFYLEEFLVSGLKVVRLLTSQPPLFQKLSFAYPAPPHRATYGKFFSSMIEFDAPQTVFSFNGPTMDSPIQTGNDELNQVVSQYCQNIFQQLPRSGNIEPRLRSIFLTRSSRLPGQDEASKQLGFSHRTLHRRLQG